MSNGKIKDKVQKFRARLPKLTGSTLTFGGIGIALEFSEIPNFQNEIFTFILLGIKYTAYALAVYKYGMDNKESDKPNEIIERITKDLK
jgi:hypothetical protein